MELDREATQEIAKLKTSISELERERNDWRTGSYEKGARIGILEQEVEWFKDLVMKLATSRK